VPLMLYLLMAFVRKAIQRRGNAQEELELMQRIAKKDQSALAALYDLYSTLVYSLVFKILQRQDEAEDLMQEIFVQVWEKASFFRAQKGNVYAWIVTMARNRAIDRIRAQKNLRNYKQRVLLEEGQIPKHTFDDDPLDALVLAERSEMVKGALEQLTEAQREVLQYAYFGGYSQSEIAKMLSLPLGTVKTRMRQAMLKLHKILKKKVS